MSSPTPSHDTKKTKYPVRAPEEQVKACVAKDFFSAYDTTNFIGKIDFSVAEKVDGTPLMAPYLLWAEAKKGRLHDIDESFVQLILTIGKAKTCEAHLPPRFLGAFDAARIAFLPYEKIMDVFSVTDFNWNVPPSDHGTREFRLLRKRVADILASEKLLFDYLADEAELKRFIRRNFARHAQPGVTQIRITKNNFPHVYNKWRAAVKPSIDFTAWEAARKSGIIDADFFLADLLSESDKTLTASLNILLRSDRYRQAAGKNFLGQTLFTEIGFTDGQKAHRDFWRLYERPPKQEYWDYIVNRRDLLVPQDIREVKGAFFTPSRWVELSQEYLARALGENWQDEYVVWDCCAGTGNLLAGLTNKRNLWASTLDQADVDVMLQRIQNMNKGLASGDNGANLYPSHVFQFDFLNDSFDKLPEALRAIVNDPEKRKKLVIYINPPYAEGDNRKGEGRSGVAANTLVSQRYASRMGYGKRELFVQFFTRINEELQGCILGEFSKLKILQAPKFEDVRRHFRPELLSIFLVPADTFDNVKGQFPIGFKVWNTAKQSDFEDFQADVYDANGNQLGAKTLFAYKNEPVINDWIVQFASNARTSKSMGTIIAVANDFQNRNTINLCEPNKPWNHKFQWQVTPDNVMESCIYFSVRLCMDATWLNDRDQFLFPKDTWKDDKEFHWDCLVYTLFHGQNRIKSSDGPNHWVPFSEEEIGTRDEITSHFMIDLLAGKTENRPVQGDLFQETEKASSKPILSPEARTVLAAAKALYRHYHAQPASNPDASFYDIRLHFQKTDDRGRMNPTSDDETYNALLAALRTAQKPLAARIAEAVYRHGFLK
ncbi:MAG: hypothetical protein IK066_06865 [Kiritimatiellae bacterium]|nr:hypothetical protein [Kiritimatiellia bacterium]